jgi:hypothetical protein
MAKLVPLSRTEHRGKKWRRGGGYAFEANGAEAVGECSPQETQRIIHMP